MIKIAIYVIIFVVLMLLIMTSYLNIFTVGEAPDRFTGCDYRSHLVEYHSQEIDLSMCNL